MTPSEKQFKLSEIDRQVQMLLDERRAVDATPPTTYKVWEPGHCELYFRTVTCTPTRKDTTHDTLFVDTGVAHATQEAAERHHSFLVMLHDLHKFAVEHNEGWKPDWEDTDSRKFLIERHNGRITTQHRHGFQANILPAFKSSTIAQKAINTFGDRLKILFEYYNS